VIDPGRGTSLARMRGPNVLAVVFQEYRSAGEIRTDDSGRLLVLGFWKIRNCRNLPSRIVTTRTMTGVRRYIRWPRIGRRSGRRWTEYTGGWLLVLVTPPDFAPSLSHVTTLYGRCSRGGGCKGLMPLPEKPSFTSISIPSCPELPRFSGSTASFGGTRP